MRSLAAFVISMAVSGTVVAATYPEKEIKLINPYPVTGPVDIAGSVASNRVLQLMQDFSAPSLTDILAWRLRQTLNSGLGKPVELERRPLARTVEAHKYVALAAPDGHTLLLSGNATMVIFPRIMRGLPFDPLRDFKPVAMVARTPMALIAEKSLAAENVPQLIAMARRAPRRFHLGSARDLSTAHLAVALFKSAARIEVEHVPYNGGIAAVKGVAIREVGAAFVPLPAVLAYLGGGRVRLLGIADHERFPALPDVPTIREAGLIGCEVSSWYGLFAPAATRDHIIALINEKIADGLKSEQTRRLMLSQGLQAAHLASREFATLLRNETRRWAPVIDALYAEG